ncbi:VTT domain-containing protein [Pseudomonas sp. NA-150]|uniref:VTT domain-containing protein n=1 Tax=Pseudomonas sp. NA-150 TaxID=3367525 RepID=UPI0037C5B0AE
MTALLESHAWVLLFLNVLCEQAGLPIPAYPALVVAGALTFNDSGAMLGGVWGLAVLACLLADSAWYWAGRRYGGWLMGTACKISLSPDSCVRKNKHLYLQVGPRLLLVGKFLPGAGALSTLLAGMMGTPYRRFIAYDLAGSAIWAGSALFLGIIFRNSVQRGLDLLGAYLPYGIAGVVLVFALFLGWRLYNRRRLLQRMLRVPRVSAEELLNWEQPPLILDVRSPEERLSDPIPDSVMVNYDVTLDALPQDAAQRVIVVYCSCPREISAALVAERLCINGAARTFALKGGLAAWRNVQPQAL